jgi:hypothetical protein
MPAGERCRSDVFRVFCRWAESGTASQKAHVVGRSRLANGESPPADDAVEFPPLLEQADSPSLATRAGYLASAVVAAVASGGETVSPEERARRLAICASCEHFDAAAERCRRCTCYMPLKTRLAAWHCPLDPPKW